MFKLYTIRHKNSRNGNGCFTKTGSRYHVSDIRDSSARRPFAHINNDLPNGAFVNGSYECNSLLVLPVEGSIYLLFSDGLGLYEI